MCPPASLYLPIGMEEGDGDGVLGHPQTSAAGSAVQRQGNAVVSHNHKKHQACQENAREGRHGAGREPARRKPLAEGSSSWAGVCWAGLGALYVCGERETGDG